MLHDIVVILDRWSVYSLSRCVHTIDQVELDSQHCYSLEIPPTFTQFSVSRNASVATVGYFPKCHLTVKKIPEMPFNVKLTSHFDHWHYVLEDNKFLSYKCII